MGRRTPEVVANFAKHYQTGAPIPPALLAKVQAAEKFNEGFATGETVSAMMLDQSWHQLAPGQTPPASGVMAFEAAALKKNGTDFGPVPPRYTHAVLFAHLRGRVFGGVLRLSVDGGAGGGHRGVDEIARRAPARQWRFPARQGALAGAGTEDAGVLFREFYGMGPDVAPLVEKRGLVLVKGAGADVGAADQTMDMPKTAPAKKKARATHRKG